VTTGAQGRKNEQERSKALTVSMPPSVFEMLDGLRDYDGQDRSEIVRRLIVDENRRRQADAVTA
jgi:metal-responsive CopG/Arc/MetJ family transcriptional regulator